MFQSGIFYPLFSLLQGLLRVSHQRRRRRPPPGHRGPPQPPRPHLGASDLVVQPPPLPRAVPRCHRVERGHRVRGFGFRWDFIPFHFFMLEIFSI